MWQEVGGGRLTSKIGGKSEVNLKNRWEVGLAGGRRWTLKNRWEV